MSQHFDRASPATTGRGAIIGLLGFYHLFTLGGLAVVIAQPWLGPRGVNALGTLAAIATGILVAALNRLAPRRHNRHLLLYLPTAAVAGGAVLLYRGREAGLVMPDSLPMLALLASSWVVLALVGQPHESRGDRLPGD